MAIYGAGSNWDGREQKQYFFDNSIFVIGWDIIDAEDLYMMASSIQVGDIIYLKSSQIGSRNTRVKGVGIVTKTLLQNIFINKINLEDKSSNFELSVKWLYKDETKISIPAKAGKLTHMRSGTLYPECFPFVQQSIIDLLPTA
jgi:hypothetical protein